MRDLLTAFEARATAPSTAVEACLAALDRTDPATGAVVMLTDDRARERAAESDRRWRDGTPRALEGVPFGVKDVIATQGVRTTGNSQLYADWVPERSATVVERLEAAGAVLVAKLQTFTLALGGVTNAFGTTRNPWDLGRTTGGTSSGSAAAVAARALPFTLGTDTGGSLRIPAAYCGVSALKPTYGRVPRTGVMPLSWTLDHVGPIARSADDLGLVLGVIEGADPRDPSSVDARRAPTAYDGLDRADLRGTRIGVPEEWFGDRSHADVLTVTATTLEVMAGLGTEIVPVRLPHAYLAEAVYWPIVLTEGASLHEQHLERLRADDPVLVDRLAEGLDVRAVDYARALRLRHLLQLDYEQAFRSVDVIVVPASSVVAPRLDDLTCEVAGERLPWIDVVSHMTCPFNVTGLPSLVVPAGLSASGLPIGVQVVGRPFAEATCLRVGRAWQAATGHHRLAPLLAD
ncbi:MAG: amidase [Nocardioidaceae bacterium]